MVTNTRSTIPIPATPAMANEPARTIGSQHTTKQSLMYVIGAIIALLAILGVNVPDGVPQQIEILVTYGSPLALMAWAQVRTMVNARQQAEETRDAVYAPDTVADLVAEHDAETDVVVRQFPRTASDPDGDGRMNL